MRRSRPLSIDRAYTRSLGLVYLVAFGSLERQVLGLYGEHGIRPVRLTLDDMAALPGWRRYQRFPTLLWIANSDAWLVRLCRSGEVLGALVLLGLRPRACLAALWALYLSFAVTGREFLSYQWDALLLETGLKSAIALPGPHGRPSPWAGRLILRALVFKLYFMSGLAKWRSGDRTWRDLTACCHYYETAPLPTPVGWHMHHLPRSLQRASTAMTLVVECLAPWLVWLPRRPRRLAFALFSGLQGLIAATGNYGFFNLLAAVLDLRLLDGRTAERGRRSVARELTAGAVLLLDLAHWVTYAGHPRRLVPHATRLLSAVSPLDSINRYGLFSVMTVRRPEIVVEGSDDGRQWIPYRWRYKIDAMDAPPSWVAPHQPRLDWQMWFAALDGVPRWFAAFLGRLLEGAPEVRRLLAPGPFQDRPPRYVRAVLHDYRMTDERARRTWHLWWRRERLGLYFPPVTLGAP